MKRLVSFILLLCTMVTFIACSNDNKGDDNNAYNTDSEEKATAFSTVRKENYEGYEVNILYISATEMDKDFVAEKLDGSILNDRVFKRNLLVSTTYNITLGLETMGSGDIMTLIRNTSLSGDSPYDIYGIQRSCIPLSYEGLLLDMSKVKDIDLTKEWWDQNWVNTMTVNGSLYTLVGDISPHTLQYASALAFNKQLFDNYGLTYPYDLVREGKWTYDEYFKYISNATRDVNEDNKYDENDFYGVVGWGTEASYSLFYGSGISFARINKEGKLALGHDQEKLVNVYEKVYRMWITENNFIQMSTGGTDGLEKRSKVFSIFKSDRSLFLDTVLLQIGTDITDMESDYGIVPIPKYNDDQKNYCSYVGYVVPTIAMAINVSDADMIGNIIEAFCTGAYDIITPDMFEIITKLQNVRDPDSAEMVDKIIRTKHFDVAHWYLITGYCDFPRVPLTNKTENIVSYLKNYTRVAMKEVENINTAYEKLAQKNKP